VQEQAPHPGWWKATDGKWYPPLPPSNGHAIGACFLGTIAVVLGLLPMTRELAAIAGVVAVIAGFYARITPVQRHLSNIGIALGTFGCILAAGWYLGS
jgi:hypothetical protein